MNWPFTSGDQNTGASTSASVLPMNIQGWFPLGWTGWISLPSKGLPRVFSSTTIQKHLFFITQPSSWSNSHIPTWLLEKWCVCVLSWVKLFAIPWTVACQSPLSIEFSRQEYWSVLPFPTPEYLPYPGIKSESPESPALAGGFFTTVPPGKNHCFDYTDLCQQSEVSAF